MQKKQKQRQRKKKGIAAKRNNPDYYEPSLLRAPPLSEKARFHFMKMLADKAIASRKKHSENNHTDEFGNRLREAHFGSFASPVNVSQLRRNEELRGRDWKVFLEHFEPVNGGRKIGAGSFGWVIVYRCIKQFETRVHDIDGKSVVVQKGELVAGKSGMWAEAKHENGTFNKGKRQAEKCAVRKEFWIMSSMNHPNVLKALEFFEDSATFVILMEYISGGNIWELLRKEASYSESFVRGLVQQLASGMKHIHETNIVHRDIKAENLLVRKQAKSGRKSANLTDLPLKDLDIEVVICDFGISLALTSNEMSQPAISSVAGSLVTMAPEVFSHDYGRSCDFYSIGVVTHMLLTGGEIPYGLNYANNTFEAQQYVTHGVLDLVANYWGNVSKEARMFTAALLEKEPADRLDLDKGYMDQEWFKIEFTSENDVQIQTKNLQKVIENIKKTANDMCANFMILYNPKSLEVRLQEIIDDHAHSEESSADITGLKMLIDLEKTPEAKETYVELELQEDYDSAQDTDDEENISVSDDVVNRRIVYPENLHDLRDEGIFEDET